MSKHNVHPDHYKTAGRERPGKAPIQEMNRKALSEQQARLAGYSVRQRDAGGKAAGSRRPATPPARGGDEPETER